MKKAVALLTAFVLLFTLSCPVMALDSEKPFDNSNFYTIGDYTLHYRTYLPDIAAKNQILLIHGFCLSSSSLDGIAQEYRKSGYKVVTVDVPNFGYSSRETNETEIMDREELIFSLTQYLGGTWIVGGHSMGGGIALNLAVDYPETYTGLVLYAPQTSSEMTKPMANIMSGKLMQGLYNFILKFALKFPALVRMFVEMSFSDAEYAMKYDLSKITDPLKINGTGAGITIMASHARGTNFSLVSEIAVPTVVITAKEDKVASNENLNNIINALGENAVIFECEKGGHMMMEYDPVLVCEKTLPTIEKCA